MRSLVFLFLQTFGWGFLGFATAYTMAKGDWMAVPKLLGFKKTTR